MADFETLVNDVIAAQDVPGCVLVASNRDGTPLSHLSLSVIRTE